MTVASSDFTPKITAGVELLRRCGAESFQLRYSDDERPIVWMAVATIHPSVTGRKGVSEAAGALDPESAVMRLCAQLVDGGRCSHCGRPTGFETTPDQMPLSRAICWYQFDPELNTFRRGCEGDT
jgi:hypothetical protein